MPFAVVVAMIDIAALLLASYQSYLARHIATEFGESENIGRAISSMLLLSSVGVPTVVIVSDDPKARFFVTSSIIFVLCSSVLLFIFVPKILAAMHCSFNADRTIQRTMDTLKKQSARHHNPGTSSQDSSGQFGVEILNRPREIMLL